jgi:hypothetical protein
MIVVRSARQGRRLEAELVSARRYPVVLLALAMGMDEPVFAPSQVRRAAGLRVRIYLLQGQHPFQRPAVVASKYLAVPRGCARICWPQFSVGSDPDDHPLVHRLEGESDQDTLKKLARQFLLSRPCVRREIKLIEGKRATNEQEMTQTKARVRELEQHLDTLLPERVANDSEQLLHAMIFRTWMTLTEGDRRKYPLGRYVLTTQLLADVERQPDLPRERLASVCTMITSRYAPGLAGISHLHRMTLPDGAPVERSSDGAKAGRCSLDASTVGGPYLDYWERPDDTIEFTKIGGHNDEPGLTER